MRIRTDAYTKRRNRERNRAKWQREKGNKFPPRRERRKLHQPSLFIEDPEGYRKFRVPGLTVKKVAEMLRFERGVDPGDPDSRPTRPFGWRSILGRMREIKKTAWDLMRDQAVVNALGAAAIEGMIRDMADGLLDPDGMRRQVRAMIDEIEEHEARRNDEDEVPF